MYSIHITYFHNLIVLVVTFSSPSFFQLYYSAISGTAITSVWIGKWFSSSRVQLHIKLEITDSKLHSFESLFNPDSITNLELKLSNMNSSYWNFGVTEIRFTFLISICTYIVPFCFYFPSACFLVFQWWFNYKYMCKLCIIFLIHYEDG